MEQLTPPYRAALERVAQMPVEFDRRWWSSRVDVLIEKVKVGYQNYQAQAQQADLYAKFMTAAIDIALRAGRMEPVPPPDSLRAGISISLSGTIEPALLGDPSRREGVVLLKFEEFEAIARRLKKEILKGTVVPKNEVEIPGLIFTLASQRPGKSPGK